MLKKSIIFSPGVHEKSINPPNDPCSQYYEFSLKPCVTSLENYIHSNDEINVHVRYLSLTFIDDHF